MPAPFNPQAFDILSAASERINTMAAMVGIDGYRFLRNLPPSGQLLKGAAVPVLSNRYRGASSALLHINQTRDGQQWPFLLFMTFKDGGIRTQFNGLQWLREYRTGKAVHRLDKNLVAMQKNSGVAELRDRHYRSKRHCALREAYDSGRLPDSTHPWLHRRLCGLVDKPLLLRTTLRTTPKGILAPLTLANSSCVGFHTITLDGHTESKRHYVHTPGIMKGAFIKIAPTLTAPDGPPLLCEGLITGLTLALVWPGAVYVALSAGNLPAVREALNAQPVVICHDNDLWKPEVGNTGARKALEAAFPGDLLIGPVFPSNTVQEQPTDFNDLLRLTGLTGLKHQLEGLWLFTTM